MTIWNLMFLWLIVDIYISAIYCADELHLADTLIDTCDSNNACYGVIVTETRYLRMMMTRATIHPLYMQSLTQEKVVQYLIRRTLVLNVPPLFVTKYFVLV